MANADDKDRHDVPFALKSDWFDQDAGTFCTAVETTGGAGRAGVLTGSLRVHIRQSANPHSNGIVTG